jgi:glycosyltransferase involved in cell wall biosynthesis
VKSISILLLTRKRPEGLRRVLDSLQETTERPAYLEVVVSADADDDETRHLLDNLPAYDFITKGAVRPRPDAVTEVYNGQYAISTGDIISVCPDDVVFNTKGWDDITRHSFRDLIGPAQLGIAFPWDEQVGFNFATAPHMTRQCIEYHRQLLGFYMPPWFPFWFADTWWDEIGLLMGCHLQMPWGVNTPDGKGLTRGLRDLPFWADVFDATRGMRLRAVRKLIDAAYWDREGLRQTLQHTLDDRAMLCLGLTQRYRDPEIIATLQGQAEETEASPRYLRAKATAEALLQEIGPFLKAEHV